MVKPLDFRDIDVWERNGDITFSEFQIALQHYIRDNYDKNENGILNKSDDDSDELTAYNNSGLPLVTPVDGSHFLGIENGVYYKSESTMNFIAEQAWKQIGGRGLSKIDLSQAVLAADGVFSDNAKKWFQVCDGDRKIVKDGRWKTFTDADSPVWTYWGWYTRDEALDGYIYQGKEFEDYMLGFTGETSLDAIFTPEKQIEFEQVTRGKKARGVSINNMGPDGYWAPKENLTIGEFCKLKFTNPDGSIQKNWSFRQLVGFPD